MIYSEFVNAAAVNKSRDALIVDGEKLDYKQLHSMIESAAIALLQQGIGRGDVILLIVPNGTGFVVSVFAALAVGAVVVPINTRFPLDEVEYYLQSSDAGLIIHDGAEALYRDAGFDVAMKDVAELMDGETSGSFEPVELSPDDPALYMYSSGSTGKPKRVTRTHGQILSEYSSLSQTISLSSADRILCTVPLYHAHGFGNCMMASLLSGACLVIVTGEFNGRDAMRAISQQRISIYPAVPFMYKMIADSFFKETPNLSNVRLMFSAGAPLPDEVEAKFFEKFNIHIRQLYGSTETGAVAISYGENSGEVDSVGRPLHGVQIDIFDEEGRVISNGAIGDVAIHSPAMTHQYDGLPDATSECFIDNYFYPGDLGC